MKQGKGKGTGLQGQQGQQDKNKDRDKNKGSIACWNCGKRGHYSKDFWSNMDQTKKRWSKGKNENKNATDAHDLDSTNTGPEAEIGGSDMSFFNVDAVENRV